MRHPDVIEASSAEECDQIIIQEEVPVIVYCYTDWCDHCTKLTPFLQEATILNNSKFKLLKINIDKLPEISNKLNLEKVPTVILIYKSLIRFNFVGIPEIKYLQEFFDIAV